MDALEAAVAASPEKFRLERIIFAQADQPAVTLYLCDRSDQRVLAYYRPDRTIAPFSWTEALPFTLAKYHDDLLIGYPGHAAVMLLGILVILILASGITIAWPGGSNWFKPWPKRSPRARMLFQHRMLGVITLPLVLIPAITGSAMEWSTVAGGPPRPPRPVWTVRSPHAPSLAPALRTLTRAYPSGSLRELRIAEDGAEAVVLIRPREEWPPQAYDRFQIDLASGRITGASLIKQATTPEVINGLLYPIHSGRIAALGGKVLPSINALILLIMPILGLLMWWQRRRRTPDPQRKGGKDAV